MHMPDDMCNVSTGLCVPAREHTDTHQQACSEDSSVFLVNDFHYRPNWKYPLVAYKMEQENKFQCISSIEIAC